jgi:hypothetical protein
MATLRSSAAAPNSESKDLTSATASSLDGVPPMQPNNNVGKDPQDRTTSPIGIPPHPTTTAGKEEGTRKEDGNGDNGIKVEAPSNQPGRATTKDEKNEEEGDDDDYEDDEEDYGDEDEEEDKGDEAADGISGWELKFKSGPISPTDTVSKWCSRQATTPLQSFTGCCLRPGRF